MPALLFAFLMIGFQQGCICDEKNIKAQYLENSGIFKQDKANGELLKIYCYNGQPKNIIHIWRSVILQINHTTDDYTQYEGPDPKSINKEYLEQQKNYLNFQLFSFKQKSIKFNPFNKSCIGIVSKDAYSVTLNIIRVDLWKILQLLFGISLFFLSDRLSKNTTFHYVCGIAVGICASFLFLIYFLSRLIPKKPFMYSVLGFGWTVIIYIAQLLWENLTIILIDYKSYVVWYLIVASVISFILCYRWGPIENQRTMNIIRWFLKFLGLTAIFYSSNYKEAAMGQIVVLLISYNLPSKWVAAPKMYWKKRFPPKVNLLSNDEYYEQGVRETSKALEELRQYCSSPKCNQWKTALKIKDVKRFASFVEGNSHLSDDEILEYETSIQGDFTDDDNDNSYTEDEEADS